MAAAAWSAWVIWTVVGVRAEALAAVDDVRAASARDARDYLERDAIDELSGYAETFTALADQLDHPLLVPVRWTPVVGRQLDAARHQADAAASGLRAAANLGEDLQPLMDGGFSAGPDRVDALRTVERTAREGRQVFQDLDLGPDEALIGPLSSARVELEESRAEVVEVLDRAIATSAGLVEFFGGPNDYLLLAANNAQMQNGQGMFLLAGVLHVEDGRMDLGPMRALDEVPEVDPPVPLDPDLAGRWGWLDPNQDIRHLGLTPRFPVTGRTASQVWAALGNPEVDGVLAVDPYMLEAIMTATGPVQTAQGERTSEKIVEYALHGQYQGYLTDGADRSYTEERRDELDEIARAVLEDLEGLGELEPEFLDDIADAATGRHLLMWSADPTVQAGFEAAGVDGQLSADSLLLSLVNRSGVKLDWFVNMSAELTIERRSDDSYETVLVVTVTNDAPESGEPRYVVGPYPGSGLERGEYLGLVTLTLPAAATNSRFDDVDRLAVSGADGDNRTIAAWVAVPRGETTRLVARFELPRSTTELTVEPSARVGATAWSFEDAGWRDRGARTLEL